MKAWPATSDREKQNIGNMMLKLCCNGNSKIGTFSELLEIWEFIWSISTDGHGISWLLLLGFLGFLCCRINARLMANTLRGDSTRLYRLTSRYAPSISISQQGKHRNPGDSASAKPYKLQRGPSGRLPCFVQAREHSLKLIALAPPLGSCDSYWMQTGHNTEKQSAPAISQESSTFLTTNCII